MAAQGHTEPCLVFIKGMHQFLVLTGNSGSSIRKWLSVQVQNKIIHTYKRSFMVNCLISQFPIISTSSCRPFKWSSQTASTQGRHCHKDAYPSQCQLQSLHQGILWEFLFSQLPQPLPRQHYLWVDHTSTIRIWPAPEICWDQSWQEVGIWEFHMIYTGVDVVQIWWWL